MILLNDEERGTAASCVLLVIALNNYVLDARRRRGEEIADDLLDYMRELEGFRDRLVAEATDAHKRDFDFQARETVKMIRCAFMREEIQKAKKSVNIETTDEVDN